MPKDNLKIANPDLYADQSKKENAASQIRAKYTNGEIPSSEVYKLQKQYGVSTKDLMDSGFTITTNVRSSGGKAKSTTGASTKDAPAQTGSYYSPKLDQTKLRAQQNAMNATGQVLATRQEALKSAEEKVSVLERQMMEYEQKLENSQGLDDESYRALEKEYIFAYSRYRGAYSYYEKEYDAYQTVANGYGLAVNRYNKAARAAQEEYSQWRSTIRQNPSSDDIRKLEQEREGLDRINSQLRRDMTSAGSISGQGLFQRQIDSNNQRIQSIDQTLKSMKENTVMGDIEAIDDQIKALEGQLGNARVRAAQMDELTDRTGRIANPVQPQLDEANRKIRSLESQLQQLQSQRALLQEEADWAEYFRVADKYDPITQAPDYQAKSEYRTTANNSIPMRDTLNGGYFATGFDDVVYDYINRNDLAVWLQREQNQFNDISYLEQMTDDEIGIYNYLYAGQGKDAAEEYIEQLKPTLTARHRLQMESQYAEMGREAPIMSSLISIYAAPLRGLSYVGQTADRLFNGRIDENASYNKYAYMNSAIRNEVSSMVEEKWGPAGSFAYQLGMSMADSVMTKFASGMNSGVAKLIMGSGVAADATLEAKSRGLSDDQALSLGTLSGIAEAMMESIGIDEMLNVTAKGKHKILESMVSEGFEEVGTSGLNLLADVLIAQDKSQWQQSIDAYKEDGASESAAFAYAVRDQILSMGTDFLGGAISGGVFGTFDQWQDNRRTTNTETDDTSATKTEGTVPVTQAPKREIVQPKTPQQITRRNPAAQGYTDIQETKRMIMAGMEGRALTFGEEQYYNQLKKAETDLEITGVMCDVSQEQIEEAKRISAALGKKIVFVRDSATEDGVRNGWYNRSTDTIHINADSRNPLGQIVGHELTHSVELTDAYQDLVTLVKNRIRDTGGDIASMRKNKIDLYARNKVTLSEKEAEQEIVAEYVEQHLLTDEQSIMDLVQENQSLAQRIMRFLKRLLPKFTEGSKERAFVQDAMELYRQALQQSGTANQISRARSKMEQAYAAGDDEAGDAAFEEMYDSPGFVDQMLEQSSFAGPEAAGADLEKLKQARMMQAMGVDAETIRRETGWFEGADGKMRWEIDDSRMKYRRAGDARFRKDHPDYARHQELEKKYILGSITPDEISEFHQLDEIWGRERSKLSEMVERGNARLGNILDHEELYNSYPFLRRTGVVFEDMPGNKRGRYNSRENRITLNSSLRTAPEETLIHEIQHAIQDYEGFSGGASRDYWADRLERDEPIRSRGAEDARKRLRNFKADPQNAQAIEMKNRLEEAGEMDDGGEAYEALWAQAEAMGLDEKINEYYDLYFDYHTKQNRPGNKFPSELYENTAGEIEARDAASRRNLSVQQRRQTAPDLGDENTVFADHSSISLDRDITAYPYNMQTVIRDYMNAVDENVLTFVEEVQNGQAWNGKKLSVGKISTSMARDIKNAVGVEVPDGAAIILNKNAIEHIKRRHGEFGNGDHSMSNNMDIARIGYVLQNYDEIIDGGRTSNAYKNRDHSFAKTIIVSKKINGTYYVVEAVPDTGKVGVISAYINKNGVSQVPDAEAPSLNALSEFASTPINSIYDEGPGVNPQYSISGPETDEQSREYQTSSIIEQLPTKARNVLAGAERELTNAIGKALSVPFHARRDYLKPIVRQIAEEYLREGQVSLDSLSELFETAYEQGVVKDGEFYEEFKDVKDYLRTTGLTLSKQDQADIADFPDFKRRAFGSLRIQNEGGLPVDVAWQEAQEMAPALFPDYITHPADQLQHMLEVARSIQLAEKSLQDYYGPEAELYKRHARREFDAAVGDAIAAFQDVRRYTDSKQAERAEILEPELTEDDVKALYPKLKEVRRNYEKVLAKTLLTDEDTKQVNRLLRGDIQLEHLREGRDNVAGITAVYQAKLQYEEIARQIRKWNKARKAQLMAQAAELTETANHWKDKKHGIQYSWETMERNIRDIIKDRELAERIIATYFTPVHEAAAAANRTKNEFRDRVRALNISRKVASGNQVSEAYAVQLLGEAEDNIRVIQNSRGRMKNRDGKTLSEWQQTVIDLWQNNPNLDQAKVRGAVEEFRKIYDDLFQQMNNSRIRNGYEPVNYRQGYFPHFQKTQSDNIIVQMGRAIGIDTEVTALPTSINGLTHTFKPGIQWFGSAQERKGFETAYDAVEGFDRYIEGVADVIHQTENIQRLRALAAQIRYRTTDDGIREQVDAVRAREDLSDEDKELRIKEIYDKGKFAMSNLVVELDEYTNLLANKKSRSDRNMEQALGRDMYNLVKGWESRIAANMVAINPGSWLTNFIPLTQGWASVGTWDILKGMGQTLASWKNDDGFVNASDFLTNRRGSDPIVRTWTQGASAALSKPMEWIDSFTADSLVRARYNQNLRRGLSEDAAISEADQWAAGVMADRSKGATPTMFNRSNPLAKLFTQFQLEAKNQLGYLFKDLPRQKRDGIFKSLTVALLKFAIGAFLYNEAYEKAFGRRPALDPIGILNDLAGDLTGRELPNIYDLPERIKNEGLSAFQTEMGSVSDATANLTGNVLEQVPFVGGLMGGGRLPISSAMPDMENLNKALFGAEGWSTEKRWAAGIKSLMPIAAYSALPFGGGQAKKIWEGVKAAIEGGSYTVDNEGNDILQYPIYNAGAEGFWNGLKAAAFGKTTLETGQEWVNSGFNSLSAVQTAAYQDMVAVGAPQRSAYGILRALEAVEETEEMTKGEIQRNVLRASDLSDEAKAIVYYGLLAKETEQAMMNDLNDAGVNVAELIGPMMDIRDAEGVKDKKEIIASASLDEEQYAGLAGFVMGTELTTEKGAPTNYAEYLSAVEAGLDPRDALRMQNAGVDLEDFVRCTDLGLEPEMARELLLEVEALVPPEGKDQPTAVQKWRAACSISVNEADQIKALQAVMNDESTYGKLEICYGKGVEPMAYVRLKEILPEFDENKSGSYSHDEIEAAINSMGVNGVILPGGDGTVFNLTIAHKAALWQIWSTSNSAKNNPYDVDVGWEVLEAKNTLKESLREDTEE